MYIWMYWVYCRGLVGIKTGNTGYNQMVGYLECLSEIDEFRKNMYSHEDF